MDTKREGDTQSVQGEGDYEAARRYRKEVEDFVQQSDVEKIARNRVAGSAAEERDLAMAEEQARSRSKGDNPRDETQMRPGNRNAGD
jgi:hypothetical protein